MDNLLKLRKHRLTEDRAPELFEIMVEQEQSHRLIRGLLEQMVEQQAFIQCGRHFGQENTIAGIHMRLVLKAVPGMQRVTHLMGQGKHVIKGLVIIQKHKRRTRIGTPGIGSGGLALIFQHVDPTALHALSQNLDIILAERCQSGRNRLFGFPERYFNVNALDDRSIDIVHMQVIISQRLFAQTHIAVHQRIMIMNGFN